MRKAEKMLAQSSEIQDKVKTETGLDRAKKTAGYRFNRHANFVTSAGE